jgi:hypothetical protein
VFTSNADDFRFGPGRALLAATLLLAPAAGAQAAVRCIDSVAQLEQTLDAALASAETFEEVRIKSGTFLLESGESGYFGLAQGSGKTLSISGGWSGEAGQCTSRSGDASATLLWGLGQRRVFGINASATFTGSIVIENMSFGGGHSSVSPSPSCLGLGEQNGGVLAIRVDRVRVESCTSATGVNSPAVSLGGSAGVILRNSLVAGNDAGASVPVSVNAKAGAGWVLNNTIADNTSANVNGFVGIAASGGDGAAVTLANNLFEGNMPPNGPRIDIRVGPNVTLTNNRFTGLSGTPLANTGSSTGTTAFAPNGYELSEPSTARDAGASFAALLQGSSDLAGKPRVMGSAVDLGALEYSPLLKDGFE